MNGRKLFLMVCMLVSVITLQSVSGFVWVEKPINSSLGSGTLYVGGSGPGNFTKIQDAINNASNGDTVFVYDDSSPYFEHLNVYKSIDIVGENRETTVIDGGGKGDVVNLRSEHTNFKNFCVQNGGDRGIGVFADYINVSENRLSNNSIALWLSHSHNVISNNIFTNSGVYVAYTSIHDNTVRNNTVFGKPLIYLEGAIDTTIDTAAGQIILIDCERVTVHNQVLFGTNFGIFLLESRNCLISHNTISYCFIGIDLVYSQNNIISSNIIFNNTAFGIHLCNSSVNTLSYNTVSGCRGGSSIYVEWFSHFNSISNNTLTSSDAAIHVVTSNNIISDNIIGNNPEGIGLYPNPNNNDSASNTIIHNNMIFNCSYVGIFLGDIRYCNISGNTLINNRFGIEMDSCMENTISKNYLSNNSWAGIHIHSSQNNSLTGNTVTGTQVLSVELQYSSDNTISKNFIIDNSYGVYFKNSSANSVMGNTIKSNEKGIFLADSSSNNITRNNFIRNKQQASFIDCKNFWDANYWKRIRFFPYPIVGKKNVYLNLNKIQLPSLNYDKNPAKIPYDISQ